MRRAGRGLGGYEVFLSACYMSGRRSTGSVRRITIEAPVAVFSDWATTAAVSRCACAALRPRHRNAASRGDWAQDAGSPPRCSGADRILYRHPWSPLWEESQALDLLGTHLLDGTVGEAFFGDFMRMHRDLLGDAAKQYLPHLLPQ